MNLESCAPTQSGNTSVEDVKKWTFYFPNLRTNAPMHTKYVHEIGLENWKKVLKKYVFRVTYYRINGISFPMT